MTRVRKLVKLELYARNVFVGINQWAVGLVRHSAEIVDWTEKNLELLDRKTRKILTCNSLFHSRANVASVYYKKKMQRRSYISQNCVLSECNRLWDYLEKSEGPMLKEVVKENFLVEKEEKRV